MTDFEELAVDGLFLDTLDVDIGGSVSHESPMSDALWLGDWSDGASSAVSSISDDDIDSLRIFSGSAVSPRPRPLVGCCMNVAVYVCHVTTGPASVTH